MRFTVLPVGILAVALAAGLKVEVPLPPPGAQPEAAAKAHVQAAFGRLPLYFIENRGQVDTRVAYYVQGRDTTLYFTAQGVTFVLTGP
ncbi:MAG: hypothetical protein HY725_00855, partial [Candidatus Rokubacteria bacterium]|nr:hypothetical protein [Candidatus Rokubacteria bacterium]